MTGILNETMDAMKAAQGSPVESALHKAFTQATGLVQYDLQAPALALYPFMAEMTKLRNEIPRVAGSGGVATHWKAITGINTSNVHPGIAEGQRGAIITTTVEDYLATYKGIGLEDNLTFEADYAAETFDDVKARAATGLLRSMMIAEEEMLLGGNNSVALGTTPTPTLAATGSGGTLPGAPTTYSVICVALTMQGYRRASLSGGVPQQLSKTNADGTTDTINGGAAQKSAAATQAITLGEKLACYVTPVEGAVAYAWYVGTAGAEKLEAITTINSALFSAPLAGTHQTAASLASADYSKDTSYNFDGLLYFAKAANNSTITRLATGTPGTGTVLTADGAGGIVQFNDLLQRMYDSYRMGPTDILCSAQDLRNVIAKIVGNGGAPLIRFAGDLNSNSTALSGGTTVGTYLNPITQTLIRVRVHPFMPAGTILFYATQIPYPLNGVGNVFQVKTRRDYYQLEWPLRTRKYEYGVYADEVLQHYAPFTLGLIQNVANG